MLKIWGRPNSICTQRALWACHEVGVEYNLTLASATMGPNGHVSSGAEPFGHVNTPEYRALNPNGTVPTLIDGDVVLWDSVAITNYIAAQYGSDKLSGTTPAQAASALQWMCWTNEHLEPLLHTLVMQLVRLVPEKRNASALQTAEREAISRMQILDNHLSHQPYLAGPEFTIGDIPAGATVYRWSLFDIERPSLPHLEAWQRRLAERHAFREIVAPKHYHLA